MPPLLESRNVDKSFDAVTAASGVNIAIDNGEVLGIIGANGAGKTTFVNLVTGYLAPDAGDIFFEGRVITGCQPRETARLGICRSFQIPQLFPLVSVLDNVILAFTLAGREGLNPWRPARTRNRIAAARTLLKQFNIAVYSEQLAETLPQGIAKLLDIAMATAGSPRLMLLDEPTSGISMEEKFFLMDVLMSALRDRGTTVIFVEHDMEIVERYSTRIAAFYEGRIIADGAPEGVLANPEVREFVVGKEFHRKPAVTGNGGC